MVFVDPIQVVLWLSISCNALFLLCLPVRINQLLRRVACATKQYCPLWHIKLGTGPILSIVLLGTLLRPDNNTQHRHIRGLYLASILPSALAALCLSPLLYAEQRRSRRTSSDLATLYLLGSVLCDVVILTIPNRGLILERGHLSILTRCIGHGLLLFLETIDGSTLQVNEDVKVLSPEEEKGLLSRVCFAWINPILARGYRRSLTGNDLPFLSQNLKPKNTRQAILEAWDQRTKPEKRLALPLALYRCVRKLFLAAILPRMFLILFRYAQPILIRRSIHYVTTPTSGTSEGYWIIVAAVGVYVGLAISTAAYEHCLNRLKLCTKSALIGLIHDKTTSLPSTASKDGEAITLMNTDAEGLEGVTEMFHETWAQVLEVIIGMTLLAGEVGWLWVLLVFLIFLCSHMSRYVARNLQLRQKAWNMATQSRIAATSVMLNSMRVIKMLGIQRAMADRLQWLRVTELNIASRVRWMAVYANAAANALGIFSPAIIIVLFASWLQYGRGADLDAETAFTTLAILGRVTHPANMIMTIVPRIIAASVGFERIQAYMTKPDLEDTRLLSTVPTHDCPALQIRNGTARYAIMQRAVLNSVNIEVASSSFVVVAGPVGCGKSTLLRAILGEIPVFRGSVSICTRRLAYCSQTPWIPGGRIRDVITGFAKQYDRHWYEEVLEACCLKHDLEVLAEGDGTQVGSRGHNLSGGQRQRVALARAVFARCEIVLLDDTFSALDGQTEQKVFENLLGSHGLLRRLRSTVVFASNDSRRFHLADHIIIMGDDGWVREQGPWQSIQADRTTITKFITNIISRGDKTAPVLAKDVKRLDSQLRVKDEATMDLARRTGDSALYNYYFDFAGYQNLFLVAGCTATHSLFVILPQYWVELWTDLNSNSTSFYVTGLLTIAFIAWASTSTTLWATVVRLAPKAGLALHQRLLDIVTHAPLIFFSETETGSILNRFSQDMQLIDKQLPMAVHTVLTQIFKLLVQAMLLLLAQKYLLLSLPVILAVVYVVQKVYLRTSRQLRFLELEAKAAVFSGFLESLDGLETLRAFGWLHSATESNEYALENAQRPESLLLALQRWLNLVLDLLAAALAITVIAIAVAKRETVGGGQVGVALNVMLVANTTLLRLVESWTTLETSLGAVARMKMLEEHTPSEMRSADGVSLQQWRVEGRIEMKDVTASYHVSAGATPALRAMSLTIEPGQKVLICGRTGSGKSSLLLSLLRMLPLNSGHIFLDGIDMSQTSPSELREHCFVVVAQDPFLLPHEDLRLNLEPGGSAVPDITLIDALTKVSLRPVFFPRGGEDNSSILSRKLFRFPTLSAGQAQLFALARAIVKAGCLRSNGSRPVVLLDEVTASVDAETEERIHGVVESEFSARGHTVVVVTHRVGPMANYVKEGRDVMVCMADGEVEEVVGNLTPGAFRGDGDQ